MFTRQIHLPPKDIYPVNDWKIIQTRFSPQFLAQDETLFSLANGYIGIRGNFEEGKPLFQRGTFIAAFYESWPIHYEEKAYGFAETGQTMLNVTDSHVIRLFVDDEPFFLPTATIKKFRRVLDMESGILEREIIWETQSGKQVSIKSSRLVSFTHRHLAAISYEVTLLNDDAAIAISSEMLYEEEAQEQWNNNDPRLAKEFKHKILLPLQNYVKKRRVILSHKTRNSKMTIACGNEHVFQSECPHSYKSKSSGDKAKVVFTVKAKKGKAIFLNKYMTFFTSRSAPSEDLCERAERLLDRAKKDGIENLLASQKAFMKDFWKRSNVCIEDKTSRMNQCIHFNIFHLLQASARVEGASIGARGLTGSAYDGHYFWDTEIYVLPFLIYNSPHIAKNILKYRYGMLEKARKRAREVNQKGALFPWRTINGEAASAFFAAGTAQYHINADIIYALKKYIDVTGDEDFLYECGAEMLVETARLWHDLGFYSEKDGKFHIFGVTGPDEYTAIVNDNTFTNIMAQENLRYAVEVITAVRKKKPKQYTLLLRQTRLKEGEIDDWRQAANKMYVPFDKKLKIYPQDDAFLQRKRWNFKKSDKNKHPLLLYFHPLVIYRHQIIKQADVVLALFLLGDRFSHYEKKCNFDYYDPITAGDSSLSSCVQSIMAFELDYIELGMKYLQYTALMDLANVSGNVRDGAHIAAMGGTWMCIVYGMAGMRDYNGNLSFNPRLPRKQTHLKFSLTIRGQVLEVDISRKSAKYTLKQGSELDITHKDQKIKLVYGQPITVGMSIKKQKDRGKS